MRLILTKAVLDSVSLNLVEGVRDTCPGCRAWEQARTCRHAVYCAVWQEHKTFPIIDLCMCCGAGIEMPDETMTSILDACHQCRMQFGPAKVLYSDGAGAFNNDTAKAVFTAKGTELRIRARGQRATTTEARNGVLRHLLQVMEAQLNRLDIPLVLTRLRHEALFAAGAFTFDNEVSPCNALFGREPAMLPDLLVLDHEQQTETIDFSREQIYPQAKH
eukprot:632188-Pyramimonas_sp.AAC.1